MESLWNAFVEFVREFVTLFAEMAPFLLLGFLLAGVIHVWIPNKLYVPKISRPTFKSVLWAALFGVPLPICSCGVIPTSIAIRREGASKGASVSFLISTPATGVDSILATYSLLGLPFAILRPIAAFVTALFGGALTNVATHEEAERECGCDGHDACCDGDCDGHCGCHDEDSLAENSSRSSSFAVRLKKTLRYGFVEMVSNVSKWLCIGLVLGALIAAFVPNDFFLALREYPVLCMLAVLVLAMPMYTCATGSIPLALALVAKGITPGAALVLLMAGPATSVASMLVVGKAFGKRTLAAYLVSIAGGALFFGFMVDAFFMDTFLSAMLPSGAAMEMGHGSLGIFDYACAVLLGLLMICSKFQKNHDERHNHKKCCSDECAEHAEIHATESVEEQTAEPASVTYKVFGMSCSHCKACVEKAVFVLDGVTFAEANVAKKELYVEGHVEESVLKKAIEAAGFEYGGKA